MHTTMELYDNKKDDLIPKEKRGVLPELECSTASPLGPAIVSPSGSSSAFTFSTIFFTSIIFCACSTPKEKGQQK